MPLAISGVVGLVLAFVVFGRKRTMLGWEHGRAGSSDTCYRRCFGLIYGGVTGPQAWAPLLCL